MHLSPYLLSARPNYRLPTVVVDWNIIQTGGRKLSFPAGYNYFFSQAMFFEVVTKPSEKVVAYAEMLADVLDRCPAAYILRNADEIRKFEGIALRSASRFESVLLDWPSWKALAEAERMTPAQSILEDRFRPSVRLMEDRNVLFRKLADESANQMIAQWKAELGKSTANRDLYRQIVRGSGMAPFMAQMHSELGFGSPAWGKRLCVWPDRFAVGAELRVRLCTELWPLGGGGKDKNAWYDMAYIKASHFADYLASGENDVREIASICMGNLRGVVASLSELPNRG